MELCNFEGCSNRVRYSGLCQTHNQQKKRGYDPRKSFNAQNTQVCAVSHCTNNASTYAEGSLCPGHYQVKWKGGDPELHTFAPGRTARTCWVDECSRSVDNRGLCKMHAKQARQGRIQVPDELGVKLNDPCSFEGCDKPYVTKKLCHTHYCQQLSGKELTDVRDWRKYSTGDESCLRAGCRKPAISTGLCSHHRSSQMKYRITVTEYLKVWENPICSNPGCGQTTRLHMDHDHATGKFRALLCNGCNTSLGLLKENPERIRGLAAYIERFQG